MSTGKQDREFEGIMTSHIDVKASVDNGALDSAIDYISNNFNPEDIFSEKDLEDWASRNGYTKE